MSNPTSNSINELDKEVNRLRIDKATTNLAQILREMANEIETIRDNPGTRGGDELHKLAGPLQTNLQELKDILAKLESQNKV
jgi:prefoldin subunit 5